MQKSKRKLHLQSETLQQLTTDRLADVKGGWVVQNTYQNSCNGRSCDPSCNGVC